MDILMTHYISEPMKIGKTHWRLCIKDFWIGGPGYSEKMKCTEYQWQEDGTWKIGKDWPSYNHNDTYNGMPRSLMRLYEREKEVIDFIIYDKPIRQLALSLA